ncbi:MAG: hypothetical protein M1814_006592 [Vezdaea aestivalis]|nr:MAG: hypothetical protein M1814_006592 [Vezdaea aestivalis]
MAADIEPSLHDFLKPLIVDEQIQKPLVLRLASTFHELALNSDDQFLPTPLSSLPSGLETGTFLAIDVGGTNLRVAFVKLLGSSSSRPNASQNVKISFEKEWPIKEAIKMDRAEDLFAWIGSCIHQVMLDSLQGQSLAQQDEELAEIPLGIAFSFPMIQESLASATLMPMGKGFAIDSKKDLGSLLMAGYEKHLGRDASIEARTYRLPKIRIVAIANDAIATLASLSYQVRAEPVGRVSAGIILATGSNAALPIRVSSLSLSKQARIQATIPNVTAQSEILVNTEWTLPGIGPPLVELGLFTTWDSFISQHAERPGFQPLEYMTSGRWLGEQLRLIFLDAMTKILGTTSEDLPPLLRTRQSISTKYLATNILGDFDKDELAISLKEVFPPPQSSGWRWDGHKIKVLRHIATLIVNRSALLIANAVVALLICNENISVPGFTDLMSTLETERVLVIAYTGRVISSCPGYLEKCQSYIDQIVSNMVQPIQRPSVVLREAVDGGIIGAGVIAGMASR